jgi:hypothetical protein
MTHTNIDELKSTLVGKAVAHVEVSKFHETADKITLRLDDGELLTIQAVAATDGFHGARLAFEKI